MHIGLVLAAVVVVKHRGDPCLVNVSNKRRIDNPHLRECDIKLFGKGTC